MDIKIMMTAMDKKTGRGGKVVQVLNHGFHVRVRWTGLVGQMAVTQERIEDIVVGPMADAVLEALARK